MIEDRPPPGESDPLHSVSDLADGFRELLLASCSAVLEVDPDARIVAVTTAAGDDLGLVLAAHQGAAVTELLEDPEGDDGRPQLAALLSGEAPALGRRLRLRLHDRPGAWVRVAARRIPGPGSRVLISVRPVDPAGMPGRNEAHGRLLSGLGRPPEAGDADQADREKIGEDEDGIIGPGAGAPESEMASSLRKRLEEVGRLRRQVDDLLSGRRLFLSASAHELKTPLTILQVYLETLLDDLSEGLSQDQISFLRICHESTLRLRRLVVDLVDLAALESGEIQLAFEKVELEPVIAAVVREVEPLARHAEVGLVTACLEELPPVRTDPSRTQQVLRNLVDNAIRHTPAGGTVTVSTGRTHGGVRVTVSDTGIGIRADRLDSILRGRTSEAAASSRGGRGSGVGLAVSRRLVLALGGGLSATSVEGEGSSFTVLLPFWS